MNTTATIYLTLTGTTTSATTDHVWSFPHMFDPMAVRYFVGDKEIQLPDEPHEVDAETTAELEPIKASPNHGVTWTKLGISQYRCVHYECPVRAPKLTPEICYTCGHVMSVIT